MHFYNLHLHVYWKWGWGFFALFVAEFGHHNDECQTDSVPLTSFSCPKLQTWASFSSISLPLSFLFFLINVSSYHLFHFFFKVRLPLSAYSLSISCFSVSPLSASSVPELTGSRILCPTFSL